MPSKRKLAPVVGRDGISGGSSGREHEVATVEIDSTFGRVLGLTEGQKVRDGRLLEQLISNNRTGWIVSTY
jgi:hypothetical protein